MSTALAVIAPKNHPSYTEAEEACGRIQSTDPLSGLSKQQKQIMDFVRTNGYITTFDATNSLVCNYRCECDFDQPHAFRRYMASLNVCASRGLARLVERGLLVKIKRKWVGYSDVFVDPNNTDQPPNIWRRTHAEAAALDVAGLSSNWRNVGKG